MRTLRSPPPAKILLISLLAFGSLLLLSSVALITSIHDCVDTNDQLYTLHSLKDSSFAPADVAIAMIAVGPAVGTTIVQRSVQSYRRMGRYSGPILVVTDANADLFQFDSNLVVITIGAEEIDAPAASKIHDKAMRIKRFKMLLLEKLDQVESLSAVRYLLYLDIDIVVGDNLTNFFGFVDSLGRQALQKSDHSFMMMFTSGTMGSETHHSGIIVLHKERSVTCLKLWKNQIEKGENTRDQLALMEMVKTDTDGTVCELLALPEHPFLVFPTEQMMKQGQVSTFVHVTNTKRAIKTPKVVQETYFQNSIGLDENVSRAVKFKN